MNKPRLTLGAFAVTCVAVPWGGAAEPKLAYTSLPLSGYVGKGFPFNVPRTVVRVVPTPSKEGKVESLAFTSVPVAISTDGTSQIRTFVATDSSSSWSFTTTTVTSVVDADDLIVSPVGMQITESRKEVVDVVVSAAEALSDCNRSG